MSADKQRLSDSAAPDGPASLYLRLTMTPDLPRGVRPALVREVEGIWRREGVTLGWPDIADTPPGGRSVIRVLVVPGARVARSHGEHAWPVAELLADQHGQPVAIASADGALRVLHAAGYGSEPDALTARRLGLDPRAGGRSRDRPLRVEHTGARPPRVDANDHQCPRFRRPAKRGVRARNRGSQLGADVPLARSRRRAAPRAIHLRALSEGGRRQHQTQTHYGGRAPATTRPAPADSTRGPTRARTTSGPARSLESDPTSCSPTSGWPARRPPGRAPGRRPRAAPHSGPPSS